MRRWVLLLGLLSWTAPGCLEANRFVDPKAAGDAKASGDSAAGTDAEANADTAAGTDGTGETDAAAESDATAESDTAAGTDAAAETDAIADTDAAAGTDAVAETDALAGTDAVADTEADAGSDSAVAADSSEADADALPDGSDGADTNTDDAAVDAANPDADDADAADTGGADVDLCVGLDCNDFNPCTNDACQSGKCVYTPANADCPDDGCWVQYCSQGACKPTGGFLDQGAPCFDKASGKGGFCSGPTAICGACATDNQCASDNPCVVPKCQDGVCQYTTLATGLPCSDGDPCTSGDVCGVSLQDGVNGCKPGKALPAGSVCNSTQSGKGLCSPSGACVPPTPGEPFVLFGQSTGCSKPGWSLNADPPSAWVTSPATCSAEAKLGQVGGSAQAEATSGPIALPQTTGRLLLEWQGDCLTIESYDGGGWQTPVTNGTCRLEVSADNFATVAATQQFPSASIAALPGTAAAPMTIDLTAFAGQSVRLRLVADTLQSIPFGSPGSGQLGLWLADLTLALHDANPTACVNSQCSDGDPCTWEACGPDGCIYQIQPEFPCGSFQYTPDAICQVGGHCNAAGACVTDYATAGAECMTELGDVGFCGVSALQPGGLVCKQSIKPWDPKEPF